MNKKSKVNKTTLKDILNIESLSPFKIMLTITVLIAVASLIILSVYKPAPSAPMPTITLEQKMAHLKSGAPLPSLETKPVVPRWMLATILCFVIIQILPLLYASYKSRRSELSNQDLRQIEFLAETPLFLGLLGSLLGVCMTHFLTGTLSAPLAYLTTISGILLYLIGRFTILVSLPSSNDNT